MNTLLYIPTEKDYHEITEVWEASVRATHHFITEEDIALLKPLVLHEYLKMVELYCKLDDNSRIVGFIGVSDNKIEMLFVHPESRGMGVGKELLQYIISSNKANKVDVNEQNDQAVGFYKKCSFQVVSRSETDSMGKPYPILHMELNHLLR